MTRRARLLAVILALAAPFVLGPPALAAECRDVSFPDVAKVGETELVLNGLGLRKATFLKVKVYVAGLYLPQKSAEAAAVLGANQPWRLVLHFVRDVDADDIRDAFLEGFEKAPGGIPDVLRPRIEALNGLMIDFEEGHVLSLTNDPAKGVGVEVNGAPGGPIEGADFASALLSIWLGPEPPNEELKSGLLGGACE